jgi:hypothetical protein
LCRPDPRDIAAAISHLYEHRDEARRLGEQGFADTRHISWPAAATTLLGALRAAPDGN